MAVSFEVTFTDGSTRCITRRVGHEVDVERVEVSKGVKFGDIERMFRGIYEADRDGRGDFPTFDKWMRTVDDWKVDRSGAAAADPPEQPDTSPS